MSNDSSPLPPAADDIKVCPYCVETIKAAATVCRYCGKELPPARAAPGQPYPPQRQATMAPTAPTAVTPPPKKKSRWPMVLVALGVLLFGGFLCERMPAATSRTTTTSSAAAGQAALQPTFTATAVAQPVEASLAEAGASRSSPTCPPPAR